MVGTIEDRRRQKMIGCVYITVTDKGCNIINIFKDRTFRYACS